MNSWIKRICQISFIAELYLANLFIVSDAAILDEGSLGADAPEWSISETMDIEGTLSLFFPLDPMNHDNRMR